MRGILVSAHGQWSKAYRSLIILVGSQGLPEWALIVAIKRSSVTSYRKQPGSVNWMTGLLHLLHIKEIQNCQEIYQSQTPSQTINEVSFCLFKGLFHFSAQSISWNNVSSRFSPYGCFQKYGKNPQIIHFNRVFDYKPSILRAHPYFWKHPYLTIHIYPISRRTSMVSAKSKHSARRLPKVNSNHTWNVDGLESNKTG